MSRPFRTVITLFFSLLLPLVSQANEQHIVVTPSCLMNQFPVKYKTLSSLHSLLLVQVDDKGLDQLIEAKHRYHASACGGFMDVTPAWLEFNRKQRELHGYATDFLKHYSPESMSTHPAYQIQYESKVNGLLNQLNLSSMLTNLTTLTLFHDRHAKSEEGVKAAQWVKTQVERLAQQFNRRDVTVYFVETGGKFIQPSVVAKLGNSMDPGIVIGAHIDTESGKKESKPGADDDGTGIVTILEVARTLFASGAHFKKPIYFIWYAAEEPGNRGSQQVVADFIQKKIPVEAALQLDMTGYVYQNDPTIWLINDYVDVNLNKYLEKLIATYVKQPVNYTTCGYDCSDHASWFLKGIPAVSPFEAPVGKDNPYIHTANDMIDFLSKDHIMDFAKLTLAFTVELAEPID